MKAGTDEIALMGACIQAKYRILIVESAASDAGIYCRDIVNREELFVMDVALSRSLSGGNVVLATRTIPLGEYSMTSGRSSNKRPRNDGSRHEQPSERNLRYAHSSG
jgi:hypothetical protein